MPWWGWLTAAGGAAIVVVSLVFLGIYGYIGKQILNVFLGRDR